MSILGVALYIGTFVLLIFGFRDLVKSLYENNFKINFDVFLNVLLIYLCLLNLL